MSTQTIVKITAKEAKELRREVRLLATAAREMTGCMHPDDIDAERERIALIQRRLLGLVDSAESKEMEFTVRA